MRQAQRNHQVGVALRNEDGLVNRGEALQLGVIGNAPLADRVVLRIAGLDGAGDVPVLLALLEAAEESIPFAWFVSVCLKKM
jgi:hypothetical protein